MSSQGISFAEALVELESMHQRVAKDNEDPEEILYEYGLEPDYVLDLLFFNAKQTIASIHRSHRIQPSPKA